MLRRAHAYGIAKNDHSTITSSGAEAEVSPSPLVGGGRGRVAEFSGYVYSSSEVVDDPAGSSGDPRLSRQQGGPGGEHALPRGRQQDRGSSDERQAVQLGFVSGLCGGSSMNRARIAVTK